MSLRFALAGNPNCGKTTLFNALTGSTAHVGNWPGVTVERKEGVYRKSGKDIKIIDLPGIYSTSPYSPEEIVARDFIVNETPDLIINIVDSTNLERNLYLSTELLETECPMVIALNMIDMIEKEGIKISADKLEEIFGIPVIPISASKKTGISELMEKGEKVALRKFRRASSVLDETPLHTPIKKIQDILKENFIQNTLYYAIKLLDNDKLAAKKLKLDNGVKSKIDKIVNDASKNFDMDIEAVISDFRYKFISKNCSAAIIKAGAKAGSSNIGNLTTSDKIDQVLTNRFFGIPIFILIMALIFILTFNDDFLGIPMPGVFLQGCMESLIGLFSEGLSGLLTSLGAAEWVHSLIIGGIINGVGAVISFLPQILMIFLFLTIMEGSGYMARAAFIMDRLLRKFGLSGKSFVPMLMGFGCSVPAVMATRTLENEKDRRLTIMLTPFMSCGAKLPIYSLFVAALFPNHQGLVVLCIYLLGVVMAVISGILLKKFALKGEAAPFIMELPPYRFPTIHSLLLRLWDKLKFFLIKAGTIILSATIVIWFLQSFNFSLQMVEDQAKSIIGIIGSFIAVIFIPNGFGTWQATVAVLTGFIAKEVVVSTLGSLYGTGDVLGDEGALTATIASIQAAFSPVGALAFMAFNLLAPPCTAAIATISQEMNSKKWTAFTIAYQLGVAWIVSMLIYQVGSLIYVMF